jgi:IMP cyclohydrolase
MKNPNGPYPGRQIFLGITASGNPAFLYLVTGRSAQSRERKAIPRDNGVIIGPVGDAPYDPLRHYTAVKYDHDIGLLVVSNGVQSESIFETYKLLYHVNTAPSKSYLKKIMDGANYEPDSLQTPRISGVITFSAGKGGPVFLLSIKTAGRPAFTWQIKPEPGTFAGVSTYHGGMEKPRAFPADKGPAMLACVAEAPEKLAGYLYEISATAYQGDDIRVCAIGGIREESPWNVAIINRHQD